LSRKKRNNEESSGGGEWLTTYGDLVTLLLTFFVLLFSFSTIDAQKWQELVGALSGGIGVLEGGNLIVPVEDIYGENEETKETTDQFVKLYEEMKKFLEHNDIPAEVSISEDHTEILLRFKDSILFDTGQAYIRPEAFEILDGIAIALNEYQKDIDMIRVDGHADSRPINTYLYPTNWELSSKRAINVVRYFHEEKGIEPSKLFAAAYGSFHPIDSNETEEGMARNRRVEIYIVRSVKPTEITNTEKE